MEAVDLTAMQRIVLWGHRQGVTLLERGYKQDILGTQENPSQKIKQCDKGILVYEGR